MSLPELLTNVNTVCGKDLAEEGEIIEDSGSCASSPKSIKETVNFNSISVDKKEFISSDRKYFELHKSDDYHRSHRSSNSNHSSSRRRSRSREHKRRRSSPSEERSNYSSRSHRSHKEEHHSSRSSRDDKRSHGYSDSRRFSRYESSDKRSPKRLTPERNSISSDLSRKESSVKNVEPKGILKKTPELIPEIEYNDIDFEDPTEKENRLIEERRKKRQAILEKHKHLRSELNASSPAPSTTSEQDISFSNNSPFDLTKQIPSITTLTKSESHSPTLPSPEDSCLAADYNPNADRIADSKLYGEVNDEKDFLKTLCVSSNNKEENTQLIDNAPKSAPLDDFDMFGDEASLDVQAFDQTESVPTIIPITLIHNPALQDNWDDPEGYYRITLGEILAERYHVFSVLGKGVFSSVVKAKDIKDSDKHVAIKIIRCNETMHRLGLKEVEILKKLTEADPKNKRHIVRLFDHFEFRGHLCLVFESLCMNLREVLKKFGKDVGIAIKAVRAYAQQLFLALSLLDKCSVVHADIKPDNILVSESHNTLKLCDLGSASYSSDNEITPYLVSRFYRAPEIILGLPYDSAIDVWSAGCSLFELYTGKILFPGRTNNHMLKLMIDLKGRFPNRMVKRGGFAFQHFDEDYNFLYVENSSVKKIAVPKNAQKELKQKILSVTSNSTEEELRLTHLLVDFLDRCLQINPEHRISVKEALSHPFLH